MKLTYRGNSYDYNPPLLEVTTSEIMCQYRGQPTAYTYVRHVPIPQMAARLTYRGVPYQTTRQGSIEQLQGSAAQGQAVRQGLNFAGLRRHQLMGMSPAAQARRDLLQEASLKHKESVARSLEHRIQVAKAQGNHQLIQQLESEMSQTV
ncbi:MAG: DUF4278 domain-containing protein [Phormidesmis sp. RL_2_1]|nr:DUF4278 domain-containing protein [Phormidesmis sp. RL_2_1]